MNKNSLANLIPYTKGCNSPRHIQKGPYLTSFLKRCLSKKIKYEDPETEKIIRGRVKDAVVWRLILNATQGDNVAIKEVFERIDGKLTDIQIDQSQHSHYTVVWEKKDAKDSDRLQTSELPRGNT